MYFVSQELSGTTAAPRSDAETHVIMLAFAIIPRIVLAILGIREIFASTKYHVLENCTASSNGICQPNGECLCNLGYAGESCECPCANGICVGGDACAMLDGKESSVIVQLMWRSS